jgi:hypothetical protein
MQMIGHDDAFVQVNARETLRQSHPRCIDHASCVIQLHDIVGDFAEQAGAFVGNDGHKIRARLRVIITAQANRLSTTAVGIVIHGRLLADASLLLYDCSKPNSGA